MNTTSLYKEGKLDLVALVKFSNLAIKSLNTQARKAPNIFTSSAAGKF